MDTMYAHRNDRSPIRLAVIIGSVRNGRFGPTVARWFTGTLSGRPDVEVDLIDLAEVNLSPALDGDPDDPHAPTGALRPRLAEADAFVVVTPEYNHSYPAGLKTAIDSFSTEWQAKPVGFVSYGGISGGLRAVEHLRPVFVELHAAPVRDGVSFAHFWSSFDEHGGVADDRPAGAAKVLTDQLVWWGRALREARARHPYGS